MLQDENFEEKATRHSFKQSNASAYEVREFWGRITKSPTKNFRPADSTKTIAET